MKSIYVGTFGDGKGALDMRNQIVRRLQESHRVRVVGEAARADAILKGDGQVWTVGYVSLSLHSPSFRSPVYQGFLSAKVIGKDHEALWSYMVTPSKWSWTTVTKNLANQMANKLIDSLKESGGEETAPAAAAEKAQGTLKGAGATFPAPLYQQWFQQFAERHPDVHINYEAVGSGEGIRRLQEGEIDFGASDMPLSDEAMRGRSSYAQIPTVLGAVVPIYNLEGLHEQLKFTPEILAGIYLGKIKKWNDQRIKKANSDAHLPDASIVVVHRSDGSGTTFVWTDYLSKTSAEWKSTVGAGVIVPWPTGSGAEHNEGVAAAVENRPNSIGYVEYIYAVQHEISFGVVRNLAGQFIRADIASVAAAAASSSPEGDLRRSITNSAARDAYPIASYTWLLLPERMEDQNKKGLLHALLHWVLTYGQKSCSALGYVPLPDAVASRALQAADAAH